MKIHFNYPPALGRLFGSDGRSRFPFLHALSNRISAICTDCDAASTFFSPALLKLNGTILALVYLFSLSVRNSDATAWRP